MTDPDQPPRRDPLTDIRDAADALCNAQQVRSPRGHIWVNGNKKILDDHVTTIPGLIQRVRELVEKGGADGGGTWGVPDSRPPLELDPVSLVAAIEYGAAKRLLDLGEKVRATAEQNISGLVGAASRVDSDRQRVIASELRSWQHQAEILCAEKARPVVLVAPCPAEVEPGQRCWQRSLVASPETGAAWCVACGASWSPEDAEAPGGLFDHVKKWTAQSRSAADAVRERVRAVKAAQKAAEEAARKKRQEGTDAA